MEVHLRHKDSGMFLQCTKLCDMPGNQQSLRLGEYPNRSAVFKLFPELGRLQKHGGRELVAINESVLIYCCKANAFINIHMQFDDTEISLENSSEIACMNKDTSTSKTYYTMPVDRTMILMRALSSSVTPKTFFKSISNLTLRSKDRAES